MQRKKQAREIIVWSDISIECIKGDKRLVLIDVSLISQSNRIVYVTNT